VARAFREHFGLAHLYLADLDAIAGAAPVLETYALFHADGFRLWVDAGVRRAAEAELLSQAGVEGIVLGLESLASPEELDAACRCLGSRIVFSLDLMAGVPLGNRPAWLDMNAGAIASRAILAGTRRMIVLDLARVGGGAGTGTEQLCASLAASYPHLEVIAGGGVRGVGDLRWLEACGVGGVLLASSLHDGSLRRDGFVE
jgi:phosphoribosylformimino-5-aminoimidazole carboxamide ribotide isomerase